MSKCPGLNSPTTRSESRHDGFGMSNIPLACMFIPCFDHEPFEDTSKGKPAISYSHRSNVNHESVPLCGTYYYNYTMTNVMNYQGNGVTLESATFRVSMYRFNVQTNKMNSVIARISE